MNESSGISKISAAATHDPSGLGAVARFLELSGARRVGGA